MVLCQKISTEQWFIRWFYARKYQQNNGLFDCLTMVYSEELQYGAVLCQKISTEQWFIRWFYARKYQQNNGLFDGFDDGLFRSWTTLGHHAPFEGALTNCIMDALAAATHEQAHISAVFETLLKLSDIFNTLSDQRV